MLLASKPEHNEPKIKGFLCAQTILKFVPKPCRLACLIASLWSMVQTVPVYADLTDLGTLNGGSSSAAVGVSADGTVVVGGAEDGNAGSTFRAFRWTQSGGMVSLGTLNAGNFSYALGVSADGNVVVGYAEDSNATHQAFRWTQSGGMVSLGTLNGGTRSYAFGVSADGNVVVGTSEEGSAGNASQAFRWTQSGGMVSLGTLNGGTSSNAYAVSADGNVVVGTASDGSAGSHAFRWTQSSGMVSLGTLNGGGFSHANGVSADGKVVVGYALDGGAALESRAFRWTQSGGIVSLGTLNGGTYSYASGVSADGSVVVGYADDVSANQRAIRWMQATGMQSVEQWLTSNGVKVSKSVHISQAFGTNADGSVVVGALDNNHAFIARVNSNDNPSSGSGMIDVEDYNSTLVNTASLAPQTTSQTDLVVNGFHSSNAAIMLGTGSYTAWLGGDWGHQDTQAANGDAGTGEVGVGYGINEHVTFKLALGHSYSKQNTLYNGSNALRGTFIVPEVVFALPNRPIRLSATGYYNDGNADLNRGYLNAGTPVISKGEADVTSVGLRLRADWVNAVELNKFTITPYTSVTYMHSHIDGYTETGGGFPVQWNSRSERDVQARVGGDAVYHINDKVRLLARLEGTHRFEGSSSNASGTIIGLSSFELAGLRYKQTWLRAGVGADTHVGPGIASVMVNGTTENNGAAYWGYASYQVSF